MLTKLLKYDLKYMLKNMCVFYILAIFFAILTRIIFSFEETVMVKIVGNITLGCMFSMVFSILFNTTIRSWIRFKDSIYKDEAYLTHTLPVTKNQIYDSKFIQTLIFFLVGFVIAILALFIAYYTPERWQLVKALISQITTGLNFNTTLFVLGFLLIIFLEVFNAINCGFFGIILGHRQNNGKIGFSVLFGFAAYLITQSLVLGLVYVVGLFDNGIMELFKNNIVIDTSSFKVLIVSATILYIVIIAIMSFICKKELSKGVNIE